MISSMSFLSPPDHPTTATVAPCVRSTCKSIYEEEIKHTNETNERTNIKKNIPIGMLILWCLFAEVTFFYLLLGSCSFTHFALNARHFSFMPNIRFSIHSTNNKKKLFRLFIQRVEYSVNFELCEQLDCDIRYYLFFLHNASVSVCAAVFFFVYYSFNNLHMFASWAQCAHHPFINQIAIQNTSNQNNIGSYSSETFAHLNP